MHVKYNIIVEIIHYKYREIHEKGLLSVHSLYHHYIYLYLCKKSVERTLLRNPAVVYKILMEYTNDLDCDFS